MEYICVVSRKYISVESIRFEGWMDGRSTSESQLSTATTRGGAESRFVWLSAFGGVGSGVSFDFNLFQKRFYRTLSYNFHDPLARSSMLTTLGIELGLPSPLPDQHTSFVAYLGYRAQVHSWL